MRYIKNYEKLNIKKPKVGDYVLLNIKKKYNNDIYNLCSDYENNHIGIVIDVHKDGYNIKYYNVPDNIKKALFHTINISYYDPDDYYYDINISIDDIGYWSKNKKELEMILATNKFNI